MTSTPKAFGDRNQLIEDVGSFLEEVWAFASSDEIKDGVCVSDQDASRIKIGIDGMVLDMGNPGKRPDEKRFTQANIRFNSGSTLDLEVILNDLVAQEKLNPDLFIELKKELGVQSCFTFKFGLVVIANRTRVLRMGELHPADENQIRNYYGERYINERARLVALGADESARGDTIFGFKRPTGYRIVGRCAGKSQGLQFPWQGLHMEALQLKGGPMHSMEGECSNILRAAILEGVRERLGSILDQKITSSPSQSAS